MTLPSGLVRHPLSPGGATWAVLDANAMIPPRLGDMLFDMNEEGLYQPRWTVDIEEEFLANFPPVVFGKTKQQRNEIKARPTPEQMEAAKRRLRAFQGSAGPEHKIFGHCLPKYLSQVPAAVDPKDVHVVSAALVAKAYAEPFDRECIVSANVSHLAPGRVALLGVEVVSPEEFIDEMSKTNDPRFEAAMQRTIQDRARKEEFGKKELLTSLLGHKAAAAAKHLSRLWKVAIPTLAQRP